MSDRTQLTPALAEAIAKHEWSAQREQTFDAVDAELFSCDIMESSFGRDRVHYFLARWTKALDESVQISGHDKPIRLPQSQVI